LWLDGLLAKKTYCYGCKGGDLKGKTGSEVIAAHDQALKTKYVAPKILQTETDSKCRLCPQ